MLLVEGVLEAGVDEESVALIFRAADDAAEGLGDAEESGYGVGEDEAVFALAVVVGAEEFAAGADGGKADADDDDAGEGVSGEVDAFVEGAAEDGEGGDGRGAVSEGVQEVAGFGLLESAGLREDGAEPEVVGGEALADLFEEVEGGEEDEVFAGVAFEELLYAAGEALVHFGSACAPDDGDCGFEFDGEALGVEGGGDADIAVGGVGAGEFAEDIDGAEGGGKEDDGVELVEVGGEHGGGVAAEVVEGGAVAIEDVGGGVAFEAGAEGEEGLEEGGTGIFGEGGEGVEAEFEGVEGAAAGFGEFAGRGFGGGNAVGIGKRHIAGGALYAAEVGGESAQGGGEGAECLGDLGGGEGGRIHIAGAFGEVVGFVDEKGDGFGLGVEEVVEAGGGVEGVIEVADDEVGLAAGLHEEGEGAELVGLGDAGPGGGVPVGFGAEGLEGGFEALEEAAGEGAFLALAGGAGLVADAVAGAEGEGAEAGTALDEELAGVFKDGFAGIAGGGDEEGLALSVAEGPEGGNEDGEGFADAGGRLGVEAAAGAEGVGHGLHEGVLSGAAFGKGEGEVGEGGVAVFVPLLQGAVPVGIGVAGGFGTLAEGGGVEGFFVAPAFSGVGRHIAEADVDAGELALFALEDPGVEEGLQAVHAEVGGRFAGGDAGGFDFLDEWGLAGDAFDSVGAAAEAQRAVRAFPCGFEGDFGLEVFAPVFLQALVGADAVRAAEEAEMAGPEVAGTADAFGQVPDGDGRDHG